MSRRFGNPNGQAWFYSVPPKPEAADPIGHPPFSQIPGLNPMPLEENKSTKGWIKGSDSKYIQLAKQGGRLDLLCPQTNFSPSVKPVGYPQCPWYYDNYKGNANKNINNCGLEKGEYKFSVPEYLADPPSIRSNIPTSEERQRAVHFK